MFPSIFQIIAADSDVLGILGTDPVRFYPHGRAEQEGEAPYATWFVVSGIPDNSISELPRVDRHDVQVDCWSGNTGDGSAQVKALALAIRNAVEPFAHMTIAPFDNVDPDTKRNRITMQFTFWTDR